MCDKILFYYNIWLALFLAYIVYTDTELEHYLVISCYMFQGLKSQLPENTLILDLVHKDQSVAYSINCWRQRTCTRTSLWRTTSTADDKSTSKRTSLWHTSSTTHVTRTSLWRTASDDKAPPKGQVYDVLLSTIHLTPWLKDHSCNANQINSFLINSCYSAFSCV